MAVPVNWNPEGLEANGFALGCGVGLLEGLGDGFGDGARLGFLVATWVATELVVTVAPTKLVTDAVNDVDERVDARFVASDAADADVVVASDATAVNSTSQVKASKRRRRLDVDEATVKSCRSPSAKPLLDAMTAFKVAAWASVAAAVAVRLKLAAMATVSEVVGDGLGAGVVGVVVGDALGAPLVEQLVAPTVEYVDVAHGAHVDDPTLVEYVPEAQLVQLDEPAADA
jgi:hypothetical protein